MTKGIIYARVSSSEQLKGNSIETQIKKNLEFADCMQIKIVKIFKELGESARTTNRTQLQQLLDFCRKSDDIKFLIVWKFDRLARNLKDQLNISDNFQKKGIRILSATENNDETAAGKLVTNIMGAWNQFYSDSLSEDTIKRMKSILEDGRYCLRQPCGYSYGLNQQQKKTLFPDEKAKHIQKIFALAADQFRITGKINQSVIMKELKSDGFVVAKQTLNRILRNPVYAGKIRAKWFSEYIQANHEPLIDPEQFEMIQAAFRLSSQLEVSHSTNNINFPLRGSVYCGVCGKKLTAGFSLSRQKNKYGYYRCKCNQTKVRKEIIETEFLSLLEKLQPQKNYVDLFLAIVKDLYHSEQNDIDKERKELEKKISRLKNRRDKIRELIIDGILSTNEFLTEKASIEDNLLILQTQLSELQIDLKEIDITINCAKQFLYNIVSHYLAATIEVKKMILNAVFPQKLIFKNGKFEPPVTSIVFKQLNILKKEAKDGRVATHPKFEPVNLLLNLNQFANIARKLAA